MGFLLLFWRFFVSLFVVMMGFLVRVGFFLFFFGLGSLFLEPILKNGTAAFASYYPKVTTQPDQTDSYWGQLWCLPLLVTSHPKYTHRE